MSVHWLLDPSVFETEHDDLAAAIVRQGFDFKDVTRPPLPYGWQDTKFAYRKLFPKGACVRLRQGRGCDSGVRGGEACVRDAAHP